MTVGVDIHWMIATALTVSTSEAKRSLVRLKYVAVQKNGEKHNNTHPQRLAAHRETEGDHCE